MNKAAQTVADWDGQVGEPLPVYVGVNLSAIQVARDNIAEVAESALKASGLKGNRLTLELTESSIVQDPGRAMRVFEALKALDATVAMDDFGTGYSSLAYLQRLPIDVLKIDKSFVTGMMRDPDAVAIVRAVLSLADALGMSTTAKGSRRSSWPRRWRRSAALPARDFISPGRSRLTRRLNIGKTGARTARARLPVA
jgi:EAL domain-containing protein (putative c-di-GMP-specific phosphodiesterase class I)